LARSTGLIVVSSGRDAVRLDDWALTWMPGRPEPHYLMGHADRGHSRRRMVEGLRPLATSAVM